MAQTLDYQTAATEQIEAELGRQLEQLRLGKNISQAMLAREAGVSRRTITNLENGGGTSLDTLVRVMRALGVADRLAALLPDPAVRPIERVRMQGKQRQRARPRAEGEGEAWTWGTGPDGE